MWKYLRFGYIHWLWIAIIIASFAAGGMWMWSGVVFLFVVGVGGEILTAGWRDETNPVYAHPVIHDLILYSVVLGHALALIAALWTCAPSDVLGLGVHVQRAFDTFGIPHDVLSARAGNGSLDYLGAALSLGGLLGVSGISAAHELTHRTAHPFDMRVGRWDFALSFGTNFATEHVYGHHRNLGYAGLDPVSPSRGVGFYEFLTHGALEQWRGGFGIERKRLEAKGKPVFSLHNRVVQAWLRGLSVVALTLLLGGLKGFGVWLVAALFSKFILEGLNFFSHYGLVRLSGEKITTRNTFSSCNPLSNHFTFNLGRHGSHHEHNTPYYLFQWKPMPESPYGYLTMTLISWLPPVFWKFMIPMLETWDARWATPEERKAVMVQNKASGVPALVARAGIS